MKGAAKSLESARNAESSFNLDQIPCVAVFSLVFFCLYTSNERELWQIKFSGATRVTDVENQSM